MNERRNLQDIAALLSDKTGTTKKDAELFLKELCDSIQDGLQQDLSVKIARLGMFKLTAVSARESVDVTTGYRVLLPEHCKVSFIPDTALAETVNAPFALFENVEVEVDEDAVIEIDEEAVIDVDDDEEEIELQEVDSEESKVEEVDAAPESKPKEIELVEVKEKAQVPSIEIAPIAPQQSVIQTAAEEIQPTVVQPTVAQPPIIQPPVKQPSVKQPPIVVKKKKSDWTWFVITLSVLLLGLGVVAYLFHREGMKLSPPIENEWEVVSAADTIPLPEMIAFIFDY